MDEWSTDIAWKVLCSHRKKRPIARSVLYDLSFLIFIYISSGFLKSSYPEDSIERCRKNRVHRAQVEERKSHINTKKKSLYLYANGGIY